jgi:hypothetical protein
VKILGFEEEQTVFPAEALPGANLSEDGSEAGVAKDDGSRVHSLHGRLLDGIDRLVGLIL